MFCFCTSCTNKHIIIIILQPLPQAAGGSALQFTVVTGQCHGRWRFVGLHVYILQRSAVFPSTSFGRKNDQYLI